MVEGRWKEDNEEEEKTVMMRRKKEGKMVKTMTETAIKKEEEIKRRKHGKIDTMLTHKQEIKLDNENRKKSMRD